MILRLPHIALYTLFLFLFVFPIALPELGDRISPAACSKGHEGVIDILSSNPKFEEGRGHIVFGNGEHGVLSALCGD